MTRTLYRNVAVGDARLVLSYAIDVVKGTTLTVDTRHLQERAEVARVDEKGVVHLTKSLRFCHSAGTEVSWR